MKDIINACFEILPPFRCRKDNHCECIINSETPYSPLCIGGYSCLPAANLLALGIIQARLSSAPAEPQLGLCSLSIGVFIVVCSVAVSISTISRSSGIGCCAECNSCSSLWLFCAFECICPASLNCSVAGWVG